MSFDAVGDLLVKLCEVVVDLGKGEQLEQTHEQKEAVSE